MGSLTLQCLYPLAHFTLRVAEVQLRVVPISEWRQLSALWRKSRTRIELEGPGWCCEPDATIVGKIGPLLCSGAFALTEASDCLEVTCGNHFQLDLPWLSS